MFFVRSGINDKLATAIDGLTRTYPSEWSVFGSRWTRGRPLVITGGVRGHLGQVTSSQSNAYPVNPRVLTLDTINLFYIHHRPHSMQTQPWIAAATQGLIEVTLKHRYIDDSHSRNSEELGSNPDRVRYLPLRLKLFEKRRAQSRLRVDCCRDIVPPGYVGTSFSVPESTLKFNST